MKVKYILTLALASALSLGAMSASAAVKEGQDYKVLSGKEESSKPIVHEFFSYHCGACYSFEPMIQKWDKNDRPEEVKFEQVPLYMSRAPHLTYAFYVAEALDVKEKVHPAIFHEWHAEKNVLSTKASLIPIFKKAGVSEEEFEKAYGSFGVNSKVQYAKKLARDLKIIKTPTVIVNKKFEVTSYNNLNELLGTFSVENTK